MDSQDPKDFIYAVDQYPGMGCPDEPEFCYVIVSREFWKAHHGLDDSGTIPECLAEAGFAELMESIFEYVADGDPRQVLDDFEVEESAQLAEFLAETREQG